MRLCAFPSRAWRPTVAAPSSTSSATSIIYPASPGRGTRLALAIHAALERFYCDLPAMPWPDQRLDAFDAQWPAEISERDARAIEEGHTLLVDYFRRQGDTWPKVRFVEESFRL